MILDEASQRIECENCGNGQTLQRAFSDSAESVYIVSQTCTKAINTYQRAMNMYLQADNVRSLEAAAQMFHNIPDMLNAPEMEQRCLQKRDHLAIENSYQQALKDLASEDSKKIRGAIDSLQSLAGYKDAQEKVSEAQSLLENALLKEHDAQLTKIGLQRKKRRIAIAVAAAIVLIFVIAIASKAARYSAKNLELTLTPCEEYLDVSGSRYKFYYIVEMENNGSLDIKAFQAEVVIEDESGTILVDTQMQAADYTALVRKRKNREMTWELTVSDARVAQLLYEEYSDLEVSITVTQIEFANGKVKSYS